MWPTAWSIFPLSQGLLLIPLALEGHTGARPHGCRKVAIVGQRANAFRQRFTVTRSDCKAATVLFEDASGPISDISVACLRRETTRSGPVHGLYQRGSKPQRSGLSVRLDLAHRLLPRSFLLSHSFLSGPDCLCSFSIRDFVNPFRFSQR